MFDSGISVQSLVDELKTEVDIALPIPDATYVSWLNSLQQMLYTEIIKEQKKITLNPSEDGVIDIPDNYIGEGENRPCFEDVHAIYADKTQLIESTVASGVIFPDTYYKDNNKIVYHTETKPNALDIVYFVKPALVKVDENDNIIEVDENGNEISVNVMVPVEFIDLVKAKLRGEAYKLANEGDYAAMWLNDYNILLETFKNWHAAKAPKFGL